MTTRSALLMSVIATVALLTACGDDGSNPTPVVDAGPDAPSGCTATDASVMFATNHSHGPHMLVVSKDDVQAAVDKTYSIQGAAAHDHTVVVTAADFMMLKMGGSVMITSSTGTESQDHTHVITISC